MTAGAWRAIEEELNRHGAAMLARTAGPDRPDLAYLNEADPPLTYTTADLARGGGAAATITDHHGDTPPR